MKNFIILLNVGIVLLVATFISEKEMPASAESTNVPKVGAAMPTKFASMGGESRDAMVKFSPSKRKVKNEEAYIKDFIYQISEARIMGNEEGKLAAHRSTSAQIKEYGSLMVKDQPKMLNDLRAIAKSKKMEVASSLGESKTEGLSDLHKLHGKEFDTKFIKMMIIDHRRDIRKLEKATSSADPEVQVFATKYLPIVKSHLEKIEMIKDNQ